MGVSLVPQVIGDELYTIDLIAGVVAKAGTGFNPDNPQHSTGSDAVRYAIALQQLRDGGDFTALDAAKAQVEAWGFYVMQGRGETRVKAKPLFRRKLTQRLRKDFKIDSYETPVEGGILFDHYEAAPVRPPSIDKPDDRR
jgi:hypothetical protein